MNTYTNNIVNQLNCTRTWNFTINTPKPDKKDNELYVLVPSGEYSLDGRVYRAIKKHEYEKYTEEDKKRLNLWP
jgi:hypothetical protein